MADQWPRQGQLKRPATDGAEGDRHPPARQAHVVSNPSSSTSQGSSSTHNHHYTRGGDSNTGHDGGGGKEHQGPASVRASGEGAQPLPFGENRGGGRFAAVPPPPVLLLGPAVAAPEHPPSTRQPPRYLTLSPHGRHIPTFGDIASGLRSLASERLVLGLWSKNCHQSPTIHMAAAFEALNQRRDLLSCRGPVKLLERHAGRSIELLSISDSASSGKDSEELSKEMVTVFKKDCYVVNASVWMR